MKISVCKVMSLILVLSMLVTVSACSSDLPSDNEGAKDTSGQSTDSLSPDVQTSEVKYSDMVQGMDFGGYTFVIAQGELSQEYYSAIDFEEMRGEILDDAIYERNRRVEEKLNITFEISYGSAVEKLQATVISGSHDVDVIYELLQNGSGMISQGYLLPINELPKIDMTKPYWDQGAIETLAINGKMFFGYPDISFDHYEGMATLFYNGSLLSKFNLEDPYQLYIDKEWTMDKMYNMMTAVVSDLNGDGKMAVDSDRFGISGREFQYLPWLYASGISLTSIDTANETFKLNSDSERLVSVAQLVKTIVLDKNMSYPARDDKSRVMFKEGRALFYSRLLGDFRNLRDQDDDYGIICYPTYDYTVSESRVYVQNPIAFYVPITTDDNDEMVGLVLECLAADTYDNVMDIYFEMAVIGKGARDPNSAEMLRLMKQNRAYDIAYAYGLSGAITGYTMGVESGNVSSAMARVEKSFAKTASKIMEAVLN